MPKVCIIIILDQLQMGRSPGSSLLRSRKVEQMPFVNSSAVSRHDNGDTHLYSVILLLLS
jgi:hypothetical protein